MTITTKPSLLKHVFILVLTLSFSSVIFAQEDNATQNDATSQKKEKKARSSFKVSAGVNFNSLNVDSAKDIESSAGVDYNLGISYKRGRFFYYEIGARYNKRSYDINSTTNQSESSSLSLSAIDIPITGGINLTSFADRLIGVRLFVSAVPAFTLNKSVGQLNIEDDAITDFMFYGQAGVGVDIAFFFIETGFNYGFSDIINIDNESFKSIPGQVYVNLGFRF